LRIYGTKQGRLDVERILVIDDDRNIRVVLMKALENAGHEVDEAADGEEAIEYYVTMPYDVVISDINMPVKDGVESLLDLKTDYPDLKLIAISGEDASLLKAAEELGAIKAIPKPFSVSEVVDVVEEILAAG
jgi:CheY-like chemotaxis protein